MRLAAIGIIMLVLAATALGSQMTRLQHRAFMYWGAVPCAGHYTVVIGDLPPGIVGHASWRGNSHYTDCHITLSRTLRQFPRLCAVFVHETGHLLGFRERGGPDGGRHSANPDNVMFPSLTARNVPSVCRF